MKNGLLRVGAASPEIKVANVEYNVKSCIDAAERAAKLGIKALVFPELVLTSYACADLFLQSTLIKNAEKGVREYIQKTRDLDMISFLGVPVRVGNDLYNCVAAIAAGNLLGLVAKTVVSAKGDFSEARYFSPAPEKNISITYAKNNTVLGNKIIFECDSILDVKFSAEISDDVLAINPPSNSHVAAGTDVIVNSSAWEEFISASRCRKSIIKAHTEKTATAYILATPSYTETTTDSVCSGHKIIAECGEILKESEPFSPKDILYGEVDIERIRHNRVKKNAYIHSSPADYAFIRFSLHEEETEISNPPSQTPFVPEKKEELYDVCELALNVQAHALAMRLLKSRSSAAVIGISGGLDSTLAILVAARAVDILKWPRSSIIAVTMPCFGTTVRTKSNAEKLSEGLGADLRVVDIKASVSQHFADIGHNKENYNVVFENAQARERTQVLMDIANAENALVIGTGDLSELALGWATYNGDHMSMYGVNSSVPKTLIRHIVEYSANRLAESESAVSQILFDILDTPVSPELLPAENGEISQCTEGIVGPYELHDYFLYHFVKHGFSPEKIYRLAKASFSEKYDTDTVKKWLSVFVRRFFAQQFKRSCLPDGPKVSSISLSPRGAWCMPSDADAADWQRSLDKIT